MSILSPEYVLKNSGEAITDLHFWNYDKTDNSKQYLLAACGGKAGTDLWSLSTRRPICNIPSVGDAATTSVHGIGDGMVIALDKHGNLNMTVVADGGTKTAVSLVTPNVAFCKAAVMDQREGKVFVGVPGEGKSTFNVWDLHNCKIVSRLIPPDSLTLGMPMSAKLINEDKMLACVGYEDGSVLLWDIVEHQVLSEAERIYKEPVMCLDMPSDFLSGVCGSATNTICKWEFVRSEKEYSYQCLKSQELPNAGIASVKIRTDSKIFATGGWDYKTRIFSWKTCKPLAVLEYHKGTVQALSFSKPLCNGKQLLACGSNDNKISIWDLYN